MCGKLIGKVLGEVVGEVVGVCEGLCELVDCVMGVFYVSVWNCLSDVGIDVLFLSLCVKFYLYKCKLFCKFDFRLLFLFICFILFNYLLFGLSRFGWVVLKVY